MRSHDHRDMPRGVCRQARAASLSFLVAPPPAGRPQGHYVVRCRWDPLPSLQPAALFRATRTRAGGVAGGSFSCLVAQHTETRATNGLGCAWTEHTNSLKSSKQQGQMTRTRRCAMTSRQPGQASRTRFQANRARIDEEGKREARSKMVQTP